MTYIFGHLENERTLFLAVSYILLLSGRMPKVRKILIKSEPIVPIRASLTALLLDDLRDALGEQRGRCLVRQVNYGPAMLGIVILFVILVHLKHLSDCISVLEERNRALHKIGC